MGWSCGQFGRVVGLEGQDDPGHVGHRIPAPVRSGSVRGSAGGPQTQPDISFVGGDDFQPGGFTHDGQIRLGSVLGEVSGTELHVLLVDQTDKEDLGVGRTRARSGHVQQRLEIGGHRTLGVAGTPAIDPAVPHDRLELGLVGRFTDRVQVRCQKHPMADLTPWRHSHQQVRTTRNHRLTFHRQALASGGRLEEFGDPVFAMQSGIAEEGRIHAGQRDEILKQPDTGGLGGHGGATVPSGRSHGDPQLLRTEDRWVGVAIGYSPGQQPKVWWKAALKWLRLE